MVEIEEFEEIKIFYRSVWPSPKTRGPRGIGQVLLIYIEPSVILDSDNYVLYCGLSLDFYLEDGEWGRKIALYDLPTLGEQQKTENRFL